MNTLPDSLQDIVSKQDLEKFEAKMEKISDFPAVGGSVVVKESPTWGVKQESRNGTVVAARETQMKISW